MKTEIEFKYAALSKRDFGAFLSAAEKRFPPGRPRAVVIEDRYFDSADKYFSKNKTACRIRKENAAFTLTLKYSRPLKNGLASREETHFPLRAKTAAQARKAAQAHVKRELKEIFIIKNKRTVYAISGAFNAELCFDDFKITAERKTLPMKEIELEFISGNLKEFKRAARALQKESGLAFAVKSKVKTALSLLKGEI